MVDVLTGLLVVFLTLALVLIGLVEFAMRCVLVLCTLTLVLAHDEDFLEPFCWELAATVFNEI